MAETNANATIPAQETAPVTNAAANVVADIVGTTVAEDLKQIVLVDDDCDQITAGPVRPYSVGEDSEMFGKFYQRFILNGRVFVVESTNQFCADLLAGDMKKVILLENAEGQLSYGSHISNTRYKARRQSTKDQKHMEMQEKALELLSGSISVDNIEKLSKFIFA